MPKRRRPYPDFSLETIALDSGALAPVAGVDEVGRGPLAGPVIAAAVTFSEQSLTGLTVGPLAKIDDSKSLSAVRREEIYAALYDLQNAEGCRIGIGRAEVEEIDQINILQASLKAMERAVQDLGIVPGFALIDGNKIPKDLPCPAEYVVKGDTKSISIAAASIIAKVVRDRLMVSLDKEQPGYGWARNVGYPTPAHLDALTNLGATRHHRKSFGPVRAVMRKDRI